MLLYGKIKTMDTRHLFYFGVHEAYENQRSRSLIDLGPNLSDSIFLNIFSSITTKPIEARFHMEPPWDREMKVYSNGLGHMTKMAAMPIYGKNH